ncbi:MAG: GTP-binding protein [Burkholderiaceae bacterium]
MPVTVIGGYLGAGKTTLVNRMLRQANGTRLAVLVNDFGDIAIDADLIESADDQVLNLAGGCVCCSIGSDLITTLTELQARLGEMDHVLLETSGVAMPGVVGATVSLASGVRRHAVIVVVDLLNGPAWLADTYIGDTIERQVAAADVLILNKHSLADSAIADTFTRRLTELAPNAPQLVSDNELPIASLLDFAQVDKPLTGSFIAPTPSPDYLSYRFVSQSNVNLDEFKSWVASNAQGLIRAKGFLQNLAGKSCLVQIVGARCDIQPWHQATTAANQLVVIVHKSTPVAQLSHALAAFGLQPYQSLQQQSQ